MKFNRSELEIFVPKTGPHTKFKYPSLPYYQQNRWMKTFHKGIGVRGNANCFIYDLDLGHQVHFPWR